MWTGDADDRLRRAQEAYDGQSPPELYECDGWGHEWKWVDSSPDGMVDWYRCQWCGEMEAR